MAPQRMGSVAALWRHPIKSHGREALDGVTLTKGQTMPWDRRWAVTHDRSRDRDGWDVCRNFMIGAITPGLAGLCARLDTATATVTLSHVDLGDLTFRPDASDDIARFLEWVAPLTGDGPQPQSIVSAGDRGMTDSDFPSLSLMSTASHAAVADACGGALEQTRWRGNVWLDGFAAWDEFNWYGRSLRIGDVVLDIGDPIERCAHTRANPVTGQRDLDTVAVLRDRFGHTDFGVYATVAQGGTIALGDTAEVI
ncbi:hypothetical protein SAMN05428995_10466 [Loktanella sp. DSM 29012]|uniref:MOSC domain-containing protein n=1 Tax=Loktanella sp. DSM 29012 TaxID=1881056 RepID=UPI0008BA39F6|nr:MOSC domain-containing protein [Loktanella sp. DSM 29012]SEQ37379.1 hypothetical protein SAMN05428995_10466 [Loktanella sp. DSM 29012]